MDDVSDPSSGIHLKSRSDVETRQLWDDDSDFWEDPATLLALDQLSIAEVKDAAQAAKHEQSTRGGPPPTNPPRGNGKGSGGRAASSSAKMAPAILPRPSQPQSQSKDVYCQVIT